MLQTRRMVLVKSCPSFAVGLVVCALAAGCDTPEKDPTLTVSGHTMGTWYTVKIAHPHDDLTDAVLRREVERRLNQIEMRFSTYDPSSELARFNASREVQWVDVSKELASVMAEAVLAGRHTDGAFDPTVGPLVNLWNFGPNASDEKTVPTDEAVTAARSTAGLKKLDVQIDPPALRKQIPDLYVDLSGIAKGYAADEVSHLLLQMALENHMVEVGGEVATMGLNVRGQPWRVGIERPVFNQVNESKGEHLASEPIRRRVQRVVHLSGQALATSGDYRNYFQVGEKLYSHIIDPRTGRPVEHDLASASVIDPSCMRADAMATAMMVLGPEEGMKLAEEQELAVMLIIESGKGFTEMMSPEFEQYLARPSTDDAAPAQPE